MSPRALFHLRSDRYTSDLITKYCADMTATARSMEQALQGWRDFYQIEEEAYIQLRSLLHGFGIPVQFVHSTDEGHGNLTPPGSSIVDRSFIRTDPRQFDTTSSKESDEALGAHIESGIPERGSSNQVAFASPFASAVANQGFSNQGSNVNLFGLGITNEGLSSEEHSTGLFDMGTFSGVSSSQGFKHVQNSDTSVYTGGLDFPAFANNRSSSESFQQGDSIASNQLCDTTTEDFKSAALTAPHPISEWSSRLRPCVRCWKRNLRVHSVSLFQWSLVDKH